MNLTGAVFEKMFGIEKRGIHLPLRRLLNEVNKVEQFLTMPRLLKTQDYFIFGDSKVLIL